MTSPESQSIASAARDLLSLLDEVIPSTTAHYAVEDARLALTRLAREADKGIVTQPSRGDALPRTGCGCGYELVYVDGEWQHDAAPSLWGNDHDPDPDEDVSTVLATQAR